MAFKICLIGCGGMAVNGHGPMLAKYVKMHPGTEMAACCDISRERAEAFASSFGFGQAFTDMTMMINAVKPDAAVLAVPAELTAKMAIEVLNHRIPLLTEKPPGVTIIEGNAIVSAAKSTGVPVSAAFNRRTMPLVEALIRELGAVNLAIESISIEMCRERRTEPDFSMTAIHDIDLARYLCRSDYRTAQFTYHVHAACAPAADIHMMAETESGAVVSLGIFPMCGSVAERVTVRMREHTFYAELPIYNSADAPGRIVHTAGNSVADVIPGEEYDNPAEANGFLGELNSFLDAVRRGEVPAHSVEESLQSLEVACYISQRMPIYIKK